MRFKVFLFASLVAIVPVLGGGFLTLSVTLPFSPPSTADGTEAFSFMVYGDIQDNYRNGHNALVEQMLEESAHLVFNAGDISPGSGKHYDRDVYPVVERLARRVPFFPAIGNHDVDWGDPCSRCGFSAFFRETFDYLGGQRANGHLLQPGNQKLWYSLVYRGVLFIVLDSNLFIDEGKYRRTHALEPYQNYREEQLVWLRDLLSASSRDPAIRSRFVFFHHSPFFSDETDPVPIFGIGGHPGHRRMVVEQTVPSDGLDRQRFLLDLFREHRVTAVFTGHEHYYERWREVIREDGQIIHVLNWIVTGLGGVKPRGTPEYKREEIAELLEEETVYRDYLGRISEIDSGWSAELLHVYPSPDRTVATFHNYVLVTVGDSEISFQTKDRVGNVRDSGLFRSVRSSRRGLPGGPGQASPARQ